MLWSRIIRGFQQIPPAFNVTVRRRPSSRPPARAASGRRPSVASADCVERRTHRDRLELSAADVVISADQPFAGGCRSRGRSEAPQTEAEILINCERQRVVAQRISLEEKKVIWPRLIKMNSNFDVYQEVVFRSPDLHHSAPA